MTTKLPYVNRPGVILKILTKIKEAKTPDRFTTDFLETKLGCRGGNDRAFISFGKKLSLLNTDGTPSDLYKAFRNPGTSAAALAQALKHAYHELFERNEHADSLPREQLKGLLLEITGLEPTNRIVQLVCQTFETLKKSADFDATLKNGAAHTGQPEDKQEVAPEKPENGNSREFSLGLAYTINLVLPKSDDPAVFNAIFRSLRDNLLKN